MVNLPKNYDPENFLGRDRYFFLGSDRGSRWDLGRDLRVDGRQHYPTDMLISSSDT
jgi:hypothetical protein